MSKSRLITPAFESLASLMTALYPDRAKTVNDEWSARLMRRAIGYALLFLLVDTVLSVTVLGSWWLALSSYPIVCLDTYHELRGIMAWRSRMREHERAMGSD